MTIKREREGDSGFAGTRNAPGLQCEQTGFTLVECPKCAGRKVNFLKVAKNQITFKCQSCGEVWDQAT